MYFIRYRCEKGHGKVSVHYCRRQMLWQSFNICLNISVWKKVVTDWLPDISINRDTLPMWKSVCQIYGWEVFFCLFLCFLFKKVVTVWMWFRKLILTYQAENDPGPHMATPDQPLHSTTVNQHDTPILSDHHTLSWLHNGWKSSPLTSGQHKLYTWLHLGP